MANLNRDLLTIGVFFIAIFLALIVGVTGALLWLDTIPLVMVIFGGWMFVLAELQRLNPEKYARNVFGNIQLGLVLVGVGGAWYLAYINWIYSIALIVLMIGIVAVISGFLHGKKP
jgi:hypothetical protein